MGMADTSFLWPLGVVLVNLGLDGGAFLVFLGSAVPGAVSPPAFFSPGWFHLGFSFFSFPYNETKWEASSEACERPSSDRRAFQPRPFDLISEHPPSEPFPWPAS
jgi:hypothetical protein